MPVGEKLCYLDQETVQRIPGPQLRQPDILQPETEAILTFSPEGCLALSEQLLSGEQESGVDPRMVVVYTPVIFFENDGGWDAGPCAVVYNGFLTRRTGELFCTWGVTEKLNLAKAARLIGLGLPSIAACALPGLIEEFDIKPADITGFVTKKGRTLSFPVDLEDLELVVGHPFEIRLIPFGVIHNKRRVNSPVSLVIATILHSQFNPRIRTKFEPNVVEIFNGSIYCDIRSSLEDVIEGASISRTILNLPGQVDTWGTMVAQFWLNHLEMVAEVRKMHGFSIGATEYNEIEALVLAMLAGETC